MDAVVTLAAVADEELRERCRAIFIEDAIAKGVPSDFESLTIRVEHGGVLLGGLVGRTLRGFLYVDNLALSAECQCSGLGSRVLRMAEEEAIRRGCLGAFLNTDVFQAPAFYEKQGYAEFGRLVHPTDPRATRIWFGKRFAA